MKEKILALLIGFMALLVTGMSVQAQTASITSDQPDYKPGTIATFTGTGFLPGEQVEIQVLHAENHPVDYTGSEHEPWLVLADTSGNFQTTWKLSDAHCIGNVLRATATGQTSGENVWHEFTDPLYTSKVIVGNWNDPSTWFDGIVPGAGDDVTIAVGATITVTDNRAASKITIAGGAINTKLQINPGITLNVSGGVSINAPGSPNTTNELAVGAGTLVIGGNLIIGGNANRFGILSISSGTTTVKGNINPSSNIETQIKFTGSGTLKVAGTLSENTSTFTAGTGTVEFNGSVQQTIPNYNYHNLTVSNNAKLNAATTISGLLALTKLLDLANKNMSVGSLTGSGLLSHSTGTGGPRTLTIGTDNTSPDPFSGSIDNGNASWLNVVKLGSGTLSLFGNNSYTGGTHIYNGTLNVNTLANTGRLSSLGTGTTTPGISIMSTGILRYTGTGHSSIRPIILEGDGATIDASGTGTLTLTGWVTGTDYNLVLAGTGNAIHTGVIGTAGGDLTKSGTGTWTLSGANTYTGKTTINSGVLSIATIGDGGVAGGSNIGRASNTAANLVLGGGTLQYTGLTASTNRAFTLTGGTTSLIDVTTNNLTLSAGGANTTGALTKIGAGILTLSGNNLYTGSTTISAGTLQLGAAERISNNSNIVLNGGTFSTGKSAGFSETAGTLNLSDNSTINLGTGIHTLTFLNSSGVLWTAGKTLNITGWTGTGGSSGTGGKIVVGAGGLSAAQLSSVSFTGYPGGAVLLASGEIVPPLAIVILSPLTATSTYGSASSYQITATNSPTSFNATGLPEGMTVNSSTGLISVAATTEAGTYTLNISATNGSSTDSKTLLYKINKADQTISFPDLAYKTFGDAPFTLTATSSSGLAVSYLSSNTAVATVSGSIVTIVGAGTTTITASMTGNTNYNTAAAVPQELTVDQAGQTITFEALTSRTYGDAAFTLAATASSGLPVSYVSSNTAVATVSGNMVTIVGAGTTTFFASQAGNDDYTAATVSQDFTVDKAVLIVTADNKTKVYGANDPELTFTPTGTLFYGDEYSVISGVILSAATGAAANFGTHPIVASSGTATNYNVSFADGTLTVDKASLTVRADDKTKIYGADDPVLTYTPTGTLFYDDAYSVISGVNLSAATGAAANFGTHPIVASSGTATNYNVSFADGTLTVDKASLTVRADDKTKIYGAGDPVLTYTPTGTLFYGDAFSVISGVNLSTATGNAAKFGTHPIVASSGTATNYNVSFVDGTLTVDKASLTITVADKSREYGEDNPTFTGTSTGQMYDEAFTVGGSSTATATSAVGTYDIVPSVTGPTLANYNITTVNGGLTVSKATLTITAANQSREYGEANPAFTGFLDGQKNSETFTVGGGSAATATSGVGTYAIVPYVTGTTLANYYVTPVNGTLTVSKATLTINAANKSREYGEANPAFTGSFTGQKNSETFTVAGSTIATVTSAFGDYNIVPSVNGTTLDNYWVTPVNGTLTVTQATLIITAADRSREYGEVNPAFTGSFTGQKNSETFTVGGSSTATANSAVGTYNIVPSVTGTTLANYTIKPVNGIFTITKATLTITAANQSREYGEANPAFTGSFFGQKNGETFTVGGSSAAIATSGVGTYVIVPSVTGTSLDNYSITPVNGTLTVVKATLAIRAADISLLCGQEIPVFNGTFSGAKNGESFVIGGTTAATSLSGTGTYPITPTVVSGSTLSYYNVSNYNGTLTISGVNIDANANVTPKPVSTAATLVTIKVANTAGIAAPGVLVYLYVDDKPAATSSTDSNGIASFNLGILATDVYRLRAVAGSGCNETTVYMPVYDPAGGFITGGGWITSPIYDLPYMHVSGKANFGFVSKYEKGKTIPTGNTEFQFKEGGMNFSSTSFDWLVISGKKAQYKGIGTINGTGTFGFILTAIDGDLASPVTADLFRIKIYDKATNKVVYDNQYGTGTTIDDADPTTALGGGSIVIHEVKNGKLLSTTPVAGTSGGMDMQIVEPILEQNIKLGAYPNPFGKQATISFTLPTNEQAVTLDVYDLKGSKIQRMYQGKAAANQTLEFEFNGNYLSPGTYFLRLTTPKKVENFKMIMTE